MIKDFEYIKKELKNFKPKLNIVLVENEKNKTVAIELIYVKKENGLVITRFFNENEINISKYGKEKLTGKEFYKMEKFINMSVEFLDKMKNPFVR